jgi:hypothetical protein
MIQWVIWFLVLTCLVGIILIHSEIKDVHDILIELRDKQEQR